MSGDGSEARTVQQMRRRLVARLDSLGYDITEEN